MLLSRVGGQDLFASATGTNSREHSKNNNRKTSLVRLWPADAFNVMSTSTATTLEHNKSPACSRTLCADVQWPFPRDDHLASPVHTRPYFNNNVFVSISPRSTATRKIHRWCFAKCRLRTIITPSSCRYEFSIRCFMMIYDSQTSRRSYDVNGSGGGGGREKTLRAQYDNIYIRNARACVGLGSRTIIIMIMRNKPRRVQFALVINYSRRRVCVFFFPYKI